MKVNENTQSIRYMAEITIEVTAIFLNLLVSFKKGGINKIK